MDNAAMNKNNHMDINEIRRENMRTLAKQAGGAAKLGRKLEMSDSHIGQLIGRHAKQNIGNKIARSVEIKLKLPRGWLDQPHTITGLDQDTYLYAAELAETAIQAVGITPKANNRARLYMMVYRRALMGNLDLDEVKELVLLMT